VRTSGIAPGGIDLPYVDDPGPVSLAPLRFFAAGLRIPGEVAAGSERHRGMK